MRSFAFLPLLALAACGGGGTGDNKAATAEQLSAGQYDVISTVTTYRLADDGPAKIELPVGTRTTRSICLADGARPIDVFADEGMACAEGSSYYARGGILNLTLRCTSAAHDGGGLSYTIDGSFEAESFAADREMNTAFQGNGDVVVASRVEGRRTGECVPGGAEGGNVQNQAGNSQGR